MDIFKPDFDAIKEKITKTSLAKELYKKANDGANELLDAELPTEPLEVYNERCMKDGKFTEEFLKHIQLYDIRSQFFGNAFSTLAFAYRMTGKKDYLDRWLACVDSCFLSDPWGPGACKYDHCSELLCRALSVSTGWLMDDLAPDMIKRIDTRLAKEVNGFIETYARAGDLYPLGPNGHQSRAIAGSGTAAVFLASRHSKYEPALERLIYLFKKLLPETVTPEGGWLDGYDHFSGQIIDCIFFMEALKEHRGIDLTGSPGLKEAALHFVYAFSVQKGVIANIQVLFWLAKAYDIPEVLYIAERLTIDNDFYKNCAAIALLFYDPDQKSVSPPDRVHIVKDFGLGRLGEGYDHDNVYLWMRSGPAEAFCRNNQNGILLTAYGTQLLGNTVLHNPGYVRGWEIVYKYGLYLTRNATALMINGQDQLKHRYGEDWEPIKKFHKPGRPKWDDDTMWWFDYEEPKEQYGQFIGGSDNGNIWKMSASADKVFGELVSAYTRHCALINKRLVVIVDHVKANTGVETIWFRGNSAKKVSVKETNVMIEAEDGVNARAAFAGTASIDVSAEVWEFQPEIGGYFTAKMEAQPGDNILVSVIWPGKETLSENVSVSLEKNVGGFSIKVYCLGDEYNFNVHADGSGLRF